MEKQCGGIRCSWERRWRAVDLDNLDRVNEAKEIIDGVRANIITLENSSVKLLHGAIYVVLEVALDRALSLLDEVSESMAAEMEQEE